MIEDILKGMAQAIYTEFGEAYQICTDKIEQGLEKPCFYLSCADAQQNVFLGNVYIAEHRFMVLYFPESEEIQTECMDVTDRLWFALEIIDTGNGKFMAQNMQADVRDGILNFSVDYGGHFRRERELCEYMKHLQGNYKGV